jgi:hypothetical protein
MRITFHTPRTGFPIEKFMTGAPQDFLGPITQNALSGAIPENDSLLVIEGVYTISSMRQYGEDVIHNISPLSFVWLASDHRAKSMPQASQDKTAK